MSNKLYVGNLSYNSTEHDVEELFAQFGEVTSATVIMDRYTNQSKGFGFVEMADGAAAEAAISALDGKDFQGRMIKVNVAKSREERPRRDNW